MATKLQKVDAEKLWEKFEVVTVSGELSSVNCYDITYKAGLDWELHSALDQPTMTTVTSLQWTTNMYTCTLEFAWHMPFVPGSLHSFM